MLLMSCMVRNNNLWKNHETTKNVVSTIKKRSQYIAKKKNKLSQAHVAIPSLA